MSEPTKQGGGRTPWAPAHFGEVRCCCRHWDARECVKLRTSHAPTGMWHWSEEKCDCLCHDPELESSEGER